MKKADNFNAGKWLVENKITTQSRLNENEISKNIENLVDEKGWESWDDVENEIEEIREKFDLLDSTSRYDEAWSKFEELYYVNPIELKKYFENKITTQSRLNENVSLTSKIAQLPDFNTAENTEKATLVVGKYAVVRYDDREYEDGQDMYVVWDNTGDQDEIGSYDDVPEFESIYPNEVAAWLEQNA